MSARSGALTMIKVGNGASPEVFSIINGIRRAQFLLSNQLLNSSHAASGPWRLIQASGGLQSLTVTASGVFTDSASERAIRGYAIANSINHYRLYFAKGDSMSGAFHISSYAQQAATDNQEEYSFTLQSAGDITYQPA